MKYLTRLFILLCCYSLYLIQHNRKKKKNDLFLAAESGNIPMVDHLIKQHNCSPQDKDYSGSNALHYAAFRGRIAMVDHLIKKYNCSLKDKDNEGRNALHSAAFGGRIAMIDHLIKQYNCSPHDKDHTGMNALHYAAFGDKIFMVDHLIKTYDCSPNDKDYNGYTPLDLIYDKMKKTNSNTIWQKYNTLWELIIQQGGRCNKYANPHSDNNIPEKPQPPKKKSNPNSSIDDLHFFG